MDYGLCSLPSFYWIIATVLFLFKKIFNIYILREKHLTFNLSIRGRTGVSCEIGVQFCISSVTRVFLAPFAVSLLLPPSCSAPSAVP